VFIAKLFWIKLFIKFNVTFEPVEYIPPPFKALLNIIEQLINDTDEALIKSAPPSDALFCANNTLFAAITDPLFTAIPPPWLLDIIEL